MLVLLLLVVTPSPASAAVLERAPEAATWLQPGPLAEPRLRLYFFWSRHCPHCLRARPFVESLPRSRPWLDVYALEVADHPEHRRLYADLAVAFGEEPASVPAFFWCGRMAVGYDDDAGLGRRIAESLDDCHAHLAAGGSLQTWQAPEPATEPAVPGLDVGRYSLPVLTLVLAGLDSFNPCAFFVLLVLLSLLVHAGSRARMMIVGGGFVLISGLLYFVFMAAWLNLFLVVGHLGWITTGAGLLAVGIAALNLKDYFLAGRGPSLSIPEGARPRLFERMRGLLELRSLPALLLGTAVLALLANSYELLCTVGFPLVYTRTLTLSELSAPAYYGYLALYNVVYVLPMLVIVLLFAYTLGSRKLSAAEGRALKLLSGLMMLALGLALVIRPQLLGSLQGALALLGAALVPAALLIWRERRLSHRAR